MNKLSGRINRALVGLAFIALSISLISVRFTDVHASGGPSPRYGTVAAKGLVLGPNSKPVWAEYDAEGNIVREIGEAVGELENATVMPAGTYRAYVNAFNEVEAAHSAHRRILYRDEYLSTSFALADGTVVDAPPLKKDTWSVIVRKKENFYDRSMGLVLHESPLDLLRLQNVPDSARAVLLGEDRRVITTANVNIGYWTAYYTPKDALGDIKNTQGKNSLIGYHKSKDQAWGPIAGAKIQTNLSFTPVYTNENGDYGIISFIPPCPGFYFAYPNPTYAMLRYQHFDPNRKSSSGSWYEWRDGYDFCFGYSEGFTPTTLAGLATKMSLMSLEAGLSATSALGYPNNFSIDVAMLTGQASMQNEPRFGIPMDAGVIGDIPLGDSTRYSYAVPDLSSKETTTLDLDGDGNPDIVERFKDEKDQYWYNVWLGDSDPEEDAPDLTRLADYNPDLSDQGLLQQISKDDLENTDFYVYRVSNGQLVTSRKGLRPDESNPYYGGGASTDTQSLVNYRMLMRGPASFNFLRPVRFEDWQASTNINEELRGRKADHLRVGEQVKVIMINRATGYIGSAIGTFGENLGSGLISFSPEQIIMRPPNLKIKAERTYNIESGLTADEQREYIIGFEGSGLTSDQYITITTEWVDWDGSPLPEDLPGYTGRLAKVVEEDVLGPVSGRIANFDIKPGKHIQLVQLPQEDIDNSHFYIHVSGESMEGNPDFSGSAFASTGTAGEGALQYRPDHYVPVKTAIYDEDTTWARKIALQKAVDEGNTGLEEAEPFYQWVYRPEMQFSLFDLEVTKIERKDIEGNIVDIMGSEIPVLSLSDEQVEFFYYLLADELPVLAPFGPERELIFALGGQELKAVIDENYSLKFDNVAHLALLEPEDFLSIRLYQNSDDENVLWEYAFITISLLPSGTADQIIEVSADDSEAIVHALVLDGLSQDEPTAYTLQWQIEGDGVLTKDFETNTTGSFSTVLHLPPIAGTTARVSARLGSEESNPEFRTPTYQVVPGVPGSIEVEQEGKIAIGGMGKIDIEITVKDHFGNLVEDGTPVSISVPDVHVEADEATEDGKFHATITGLDKAGIKDMVVQAGDVEVTETLTVYDIEFAWQIPAQIRAEQTVPVTLTATSSYGDLTGLKVHVTAFRGKLQDDILTIQDGQAQTNYYAGPFRGDAQLYARVGDSAMYHEFYVNEASDDLELSETIIVGDVVSDGSFDVATEDGLIPVGYKAGTDLILKGMPGETKEISLGSLAEPAKEPVLNYQMDWVASDGKVIDIFQGIDAESDDISLEFDSPRGFSNSFKFTENSEIRVSLDPLLNKANNLGFGFWFKPSKTNTGLVEYGLRSLYLTIDAEKRIVFSINTTSGFFSIASEPIALNQWHEVGVAYKDDKVMLEVNGRIYEAPATGELIEQADLEYALRIGTGYEGLMSSFRVNDWTNPSLIEFGDGSASTSVTIGPDGTHSIHIRSTGQITAQAERFQRRLIRAYAAAQKNSFLKFAYASTLPAFCNEEPPESVLGLEALEYLFDYLEKCYLAQKLDQAKIRVRTGDGFRERLLGIRDFATYQTLSLIVMRARSVITMVNCVEGFLVGSGGSVTSMICDFISGFLLWGDIRDFIFHFYYFHFGDEGKFDQATYTLAGLGIITNLLEVGGFFAAVAPGVVFAGADAAVAGSKTAVKVFRRAGKLARYMDELVGFLSRNVMDAGKLEDKARALTKVMPILELTAVVAFYKDDFADVIELLMDTVQTEGGFLNLASYIYGYFIWHENQSKQAAILNDPSKSFIDDAYANLIPIRKPIDDIIKLLRRVDNYAREKAIQEIGAKLKRVIKELQDAKLNEIDEIVEIMYEPETLEAFMLAAELGEDSARKLRNLYGSRIMSHIELFSEMSELPGELTKSFPDGLVDIFRRFDVTNGARLTPDNSRRYINALNQSQGAAHEIHLIHYFHKSGDNLKGIQVERIIYNVHGDEIAKRVDDVVLDLGAGRELLCDSKAWEPSTIRDRLQKSLKPTIDPETGSETIGQLYKDIVDMRVRGDYNRRYFFDARFSDSGYELGQIREWIMEGIEVPDVKARLMKDLNLRPGTGPGSWDEFVDELFEGLEDFAQITPAHGTY